MCCNVTYRAENIRTIDKGIKTDRYIEINVNRKGGNIMARCNRCGKYFPAQEDREHCSTCHSKLRMRSIYTGVYADIDKPKPRKPKKQIMTDSEQRKIDDSVRMRFGLPVDKGRTIDKDSEEFKQLAEELIERESKRGKKLQEHEYKISRMAL